jgi:hypothetical protein
VTVSLDATAEEFTDFYLDDDIRPTWVSCTGSSGAQHRALHGQTPAAVPPAAW